MPLGYARSHGVTHRALNNPRSAVGTLLASSGSRYAKIPPKQSLEDGSWESSTWLLQKEG